MTVEDVMQLGIATIPAITAVCYVIGMLVKASKIPSEWIPVIMCLTGGLLGVIAMLTMPEFPANDYMTSVAIGAISGLAATGINQVFAQAKNAKAIESEAGKQDEK